MSSLLQSTRNTRALPTGTLRYIRSEVPENLTNEEIQWLLDHDITTIIDLRSDEELVRKPCCLRKQDGFIYFHLPVTGGGDTPKSLEHLHIVYQQMVDENMEKIIDTIMNAESNVMYFCTAGKDRTGVVSALILKRLGFSDEVIIDDYMKSKDNLMDMLTAYASTHPDVDIEIIIPHSENMQRFLKHLSKMEEHRHMENFISQKTKAVFGREYELISMRRILGGAQKHTYLAKCTNGFCFVIYLWDKSTTFFNNETGIFCSSSAVLFEKNNELMKKCGVLTPNMYHMDRNRNEWHFEYAFVEYIDGVDMDYIIAKEPERLPYVLKSLTASINKLHSIKSSTVGQIGWMQGDQFDAIGYELDEIHQNCLYLQENDIEYAGLYIQAEQKAIELAKNFGKRSEYTFIHSELGPNHVMVDKDNNAYLIDIEGARYYDVEKENSFLQFRFDNRITGIKDNIDDKRMQFYHIGHCFGNLRGAIELKEKCYYDMDDVNSMIDFFHRQLKLIVLESPT